MKRWLLAIVVSVLCGGAAAGLLLSGASSAAAAAHRTVAVRPGAKEARTVGFDPVNPATWMGDLAPHIFSRKLSEIVIPASHDSATYSLPPPGDDLWHSQSDDFTSQLNDGMREFDIRVEYDRTQDLNCLATDGWQPGYYAHHGSGIEDGISCWLTLGRILSDIASWATDPAHGHEIVMLNLDIATRGQPFPDSDCQSFGQRLGDALVTPDEVQDHFGTTDPGQVTVGQMWSLPDPHGYARVIMDNSLCVDAADRLAGQWSTDITKGLFGSYYADRCTAGGIDVPEGNQNPGIKPLVLAAVKTRATGAGTSFDPPKVGGLYKLFIQGTPEFGCLYTPTNMVPDEREVLDALYQQWQTDPATKANLNIISGDFVQDTDLFRDVILMDASWPIRADSIKAVGAQQASAEATHYFREYFEAQLSYRGTPVTEEKVTYTISPADGSNGPNYNGADTYTTTSDGDGQTRGNSYSGILNAGPRAGTWTLTASAPGATPVSWTLTVEPQTVSLSSVYRAPEVQVGSTIDAPLGMAVLAVDQHGEPVVGLRLTWNAMGVGVFDGSSTYSGSTGFNGVASTPPLTAGTRAGALSISVTGAGVSTLSLPITVTPGPATSFGDARGGGQTVPINTKFPITLSGRWYDQYGNAVTHPSLDRLELTVKPGSGATWPNGQSSVEASVSPDGTLTAPDLTAGHTVLDDAKPLRVIVGPHYGWLLYVSPGPPATVTATSGDGQQTGTGQTFVHQLAVKVTDEGGNPIPGVQVGFQVTSGSATFALPNPATDLAYFGRRLLAMPATSTTAITGNDGVATAPVLTAGQQAGPIEVSATASHASTVLHLSAGSTVPAITGLTNGDGQLTVAFSGPTATASPVTSYQITATDQTHPGEMTATGANSPITVTGLTNGDTYVVTVTAIEADGSRSTSQPSGALNVGVPPTVVSGPADGIVDRPYSSGFTVTGAPRPTVTQLSGNLPPGLTLDSDGKLTGTPTRAGTYEFTAQATNTVGIYDASVTVAISSRALRARPLGASGRRVYASICTSPTPGRKAKPVCSTPTLTGTFPPLGASAAATLRRGPVTYALMRGPVTYAVGRARTQYAKLRLTRRRRTPAGRYTLVLRSGHRAIMVPVALTAAKSRPRLTG